jgi:nicotinamidase-related amidase
MERPGEAKKNAKKSEPLPRSPELMNRDDTSLLVIDMQEKFLAVIPDSEEIIWNCRRLLDAATALGVPIAATEQYPEKMGATVPELKERIGDAPEKKAFSASVCGEVFERWRAEGRFRVLICGIESHVCVAQTAFDLTAAGFEVYLAIDACGSRSAIDFATALGRMESAGIILTTTEAAMFEWCATADAPEFKKISALAKEKPPT